jgi:hypothetical protein
VTQLAEHAVVLEGLGARALSQTTGLHRDARPEEIKDSASRIRSLVLHALSVLADLQLQAGRLDALSALRKTCRAVGLDESDLEQ